MRTRALVAVASLLGFYATGLAIAGALAWLPWAQMRYQGSTDPAALLAGAAALYVLWALVPPRQRWVDPGVAIDPGEQPRLHALIEELARRCGHANPRHLYLTTGLTAFAGSRPRWLGLRHEPYLGLGLPLFALFDEAQWSAVIGHEFGHHVGGDVRLGPWQYATRRAIAAALDRIGGSAVLLHLPFYAYGRIFLRLTAASSREQELRADALGARLSSPSSMGAALVALERFEGPWNEYWSGVYQPAVEAGFLLPVFEGYRRCLQARGQAALPSASATFSLEDTHPPLERRLAALGLAMPASVAGPPPQVGPLLEAPDAAGERLLAGMVNPEHFARLARVEWSEWGERVLPVVWEQELGARLQTLNGVALDEAPTILADDGWWERLRDGLNIFSAEARRRQVRRWVATWIGVCLRRAGFCVVSEPGAAVVLARGATSVDPWAWADDLAAARRTAAEWAGLVASL